MKKLQLFLTLVVALIFSLSATAQDKKSEKKAKKKIIIIEKTTENGKEKVETITQEGDDINIKITIDGEEIDINDLEAQDVDVIELNGEKLETLIQKGLENANFDYDFDFDYDFNFNTKDDDKGYLGVMLEINKEKESEVETVEVIVTEVFEKSAAEEAGLKAGDIITAIEGQEVTGLGQLVKAIGSHKAGEKIKLDYVRDGNKNQTEATLKKNDKKVRSFNLKKEHFKKHHKKHLFDDNHFKFQKDRGYLGVVLDKATENGVLLESVEEESAAKAGGLQAGDVITAVNGKSVTTIAALVEAVHAHKVGATIKITYTRDDNTKTTDVTLKESKENFFLNDKGHNIKWFGDGNMIEFKDGDDQGHLGVTLGEATDKGIPVELVNDESVAKVAGLQKGDVITSIDDEKVTSTHDLVKAIKAHKVGETIKVGYTRDGQEKTVTATLKKGKIRNAYFFGNDKHNFHFDKNNKDSWLEIAKKHKADDRGFMGIYIDSEEVKGVKLSGVVDESGAAKAGLKKGDIITKINKTVIENHEALTATLKETKVNDVVNITYTRDGQSQTTKVTLGERKLMKVMNFNNWGHCDNGSGKIRKKIVIVQKGDKEEQATEEEEEEENLNKAPRSRELDLKKLDLYPNPNSGAFTVDFEANETIPTTITVVDISGKEVYREDLTDFTGTYNKRIDIASYAKGVYFLNIIQGDKKVTKKLIYNK